MVRFWGVAAFCINHSVAYSAAMSLAIVEFWGTRYLLSAPSAGAEYWSSWWAQWAVLGLGALLSAAGLGLRYWAMMETGASFNHIVQAKRPEKHRLVTTGPYRLSRHPSYVGWALWAVGTQLLLCNPVSTVAFAAAATVFFRDRVAVEEAALLSWYGDEYVEYSQRTPILLPGVQGSSELRSRIEELRSAS